MGVVNGSYFFFQAEDGIRDIGVTGVQTCALPICGVAYLRPLPHERLVRARYPTLRVPAARSLPRQELPDEPLAVDRHLRGPGPLPRSEERRVGKECRSRWSPYH